MNIYVTLDYELFFGPVPGTASKCMLEPTEKLLTILDRYGAKMTVFVDSGYLLALKKQLSEYSELADDFNRVSRQVKWLSDQGHSIGLHIHPHWEDSYFDGTRWVFDTGRYKLAAFNEQEVMDIVTRYNDILIEITGKPISVYRAGGWSAQPFKNIGQALSSNNIFCDSSVFPGGFYESNNQTYDFTAVPYYKTRYRFSSDLTVEDEEGKFLEIPISSSRYSPIFYWRFALTKLLKQKKHRSYGDGLAIPLQKNSLVKLLTQSSWGVVSMDGFKANHLQNAFSVYKKKTKPDDNFVIIGHPKAFTAYSLDKFEKFLESTHRHHNYKTLE